MYPKKVLKSKINFLIWKKKCAPISPFLTSGQMRKTCKFGIDKTKYIFTLNRDKNS